MCPSSVPATATALGSDVSHLTSEVVRLASAEDTGHGDDSSDPRQREPQGRAQRLRGGQAHGPQPPQTTVPRA